MVRASTTATNSNKILIQKIISKSKPKYSKQMMAISLQNSPHKRMMPISSNTSKTILQLMPLSRTIVPCRTQAAINMAPALTLFPNMEQSQPLLIKKKGK